MRLCEAIGPSALTRPCGWEGTSACQRNSGSICKMTTTCELLRVAAWAGASAREAQITESALHTWEHRSRLGWTLQSFVRWTGCTCGIPLLAQRTREKWGTRRLGNSRGDQTQKRRTRLSAPHEALRSFAPLHARGRARLHLLIQPQLFPLLIHQHFGLFVHLDFVGPGAGEAFAGPFAGGVNAHLRSVVG